MDTDINQLVDRLTKIYSEVKQQLSDLTNENFDKKFIRINFLNEKIKKIKKQIEAQFSLEEIKKNEKKIINGAKEIKTMLDNIIEEKKSLSLEIKKELNSINNKRNLSNYK